MGGITLIKDPKNLKHHKDTNFKHLSKVHPCLGGEAHFKYGRIHLPVSPTCNIQCKFCKRGFNKSEIRPGVSSLLLKPEETVETVRKALKLCPEIKVAGIAGPGDTLATDYAIRTFELLKEEFPELVFCLSTNGLKLYEKAERIAKAGVKTLTVTVNAIDPDIQKNIISFIIDENCKKLEGREAAEKLIEAQLKGIKRVSELGVIVKINSVLIPGVNDEHIPEVARVTKELGASILNIIPLIPQNEMAHFEAPSCELLEEVRVKAGEYLDVFRHCKHCRADACGIPGKGQDLHKLLYDKEVVETFSHG
ncbi:MAG: radical SAM protein [Clostridium sp.]|uniref:radical SAM protein n=1 Tax=Clostridium sp. DSM 8431 TaxID=1761781 RepID=UPI0008ED0083|nr:radical SAM protein [Clostridium sp. DSM 8431]MCR4945012.1 radical SAM protein [Clostridium sp.]SFU52475.1 nitrogen fixation protein NifB [Clostridium sp. DSM 8431]